ncbi:MAG: GNAT family N-acetyltransferase [Deltaproteobacteria bacterium]|nr:GNAT family N-acetyltransferase [Deltaproteobacteria bacterium]
MAGAEPLWVVGQLTKKHVRDAFHSGEPALDEFLKKHARQNAERGISRTFVAVRRGALAVDGYYTLRSGAVTFESLPDEVRKTLPRYPVPVVHLARLAVSKEARGMGLGETLLLHAFEKAIAVENEIGVYAVEVMAKTDGAKSFYERYGFRSLRDDRFHMYISMRTIRAALSGA